VTFFKPHGAACLWRNPAQITSLLLRLLVRFPLATLFALLFLFGHGSLQASTPYQELESKGLLPYWLKLLHYEKNLFGGYESLVDAPEFFLHPEGKESPSKELEADLLAFSNPKTPTGYLHLPAQCVFVERYRFLKQAGLTRTDDLVCTDFLDWKKGVGAEAVVLAFSSSFPNNPASIFGHTFIRFHQQGKKTLLDYTASYAAYTAGETMGPSYAVKGLFGMYKAGFMVMPYYLKADEYNNSESRDLYEYQLNMEPEGVERIVNHLWELYGASYFDYYFLDENCSYILARVLELGNPDWNLTDVNRWYYLPADTIKKLVATEGAVAQVTYRPSLKKQLSWRVDQLTPLENQVFLDLVDKKTEFSQVKNIKVLDALVAYWYFRRRGEKKKFAEADQLTYRKVLLYRSTFPEKAPLIAVPKDADLQPEFAHDPSRVSLGQVHQNQTDLLRFGFNSGLHDLLAMDKGMEPFSQIQFLGVKIDVDPARQKAALSQFTLIDILSLHPYSKFDPQYSWKVTSTYEQIGGLSCGSCYQANLNTAFGTSFHPGSSSSLVYILGGAFASLSEQFKEGHQWGPFAEWSLLGGTDTGYRYQFKQTLRAPVPLNLSKNYELDTTLVQALNWGRNWELRLINSFGAVVLGSQTNHQSHELHLAYYY